MSKDKIAVFGGLVTRPTRFTQRLTAGSVVREVGKSAAARRGVLCRVFDHELNVHSRLGNGRIEAGARKADS